MNARTLVLTPWYFPFTTVDWRAAVALLYLRKAEVVASYPEETRSPSTAFKMPAVIRLRRQQSASERGTKFSQSDLVLRHSFSCAGCDTIHPTSQLAYDHVPPRSRGGRTVWADLLVADGGSATTGARAAAKRGSRSPQPTFQPLELPLDPPLASPADAPDGWGDTTAVWRRR